MACFSKILYNVTVALKLLDVKYHKYIFIIFLDMTWNVLIRTWDIDVQLKVMWPYEPLPTKFF